MRNAYLIFLIFGLFIIACQPETEIIRIPDNDVVPDETVPLIIQENYINKLYIGLLGRKPDEAEVQQILTTLNRNNAARDDRKQVIETIVESDGFNQRMYDIARAEMLNNLDTADITFQIFIFNELIKDPQYQQFLPLLYAEINKLTRLKKLPQQLLAGQVGRIEMHSRMAFNSFYDEINMGSQNFVLSVFEYFLGRYPTDTEEAIAIAMVDGFGGVLFGKEGNSKSDFLGIFLSSTDYYEGQVIDVYNDFLLREPVSTEMSDATLIYKQTGDYGEMLKEVLSQDEVLGI